MDITCGLCMPSLILSYPSLDLFINQTSSPHFGISLLFANKEEEKMDAVEVGDCWPCGPDLCPGKSIWPELMGVKGSEAKEIIERENPNVKVVYIWCHSKRIMDCCCNRVWLFVEGEDGGESGDYGEAKVCNIPRVG